MVKSHRLSDADDITDANLFKDAFISAQKANEEIFNAASTTEEAPAKEEEETKGKETETAA